MLKILLKPAFQTILLAEKKKFYAELEKQIPQLPLTGKKEHLVIN